MPNLSPRTDGSFFGDDNSDEATLTDDELLGLLLPGIWFKRG